MTKKFEIGTGDEMLIRHYIPEMRFDFSDGESTRKIAICGDDQNRCVYAEIERNSELEVYQELSGQLSDGFFENFSTSAVFEIFPDGSKIEIDPIYEQQAITSGLPRFPEAGRPKFDPELLTKPEETVADYISRVHPRTEMRMSKKGTEIIRVYYYTGIVKEYEARNISKIKAFAC